MSDDITPTVDRDGGADLASLPDAHEIRRLPDEPEKVYAIDAEYLSGRRFAYQEDMSLVKDVDLIAATPGEDINWLEDITLLSEDGVPAVFDRYSNSFIKIYFEIPEGRENEIARKVLITHLQSGNSYGIALKDRHAKFPQPSLGPWVPDSATVGVDYRPPVLEGWEPPERDRPQGADHASPEWQLLRDRAEGPSRQVPPAVAGPVGSGLGDGRCRLPAAGAGGMGAAGALVC